MLFILASHYVSQVSASLYDRKITLDAMTWKGVNDDDEDEDDDDECTDKQI